MARNSRCGRGTVWHNQVRIFILAASLLLSSACVTLRDPESSQEYRTDLVASLPAGSLAEQTLVSRRAGLNGIQLWLRPTPEREIPDQATLQLELYRAGSVSLPVFSTRISPERLKAEFPLSIAIPVQPDGPAQEYRLVLKPVQLDLALYGRNEDAYPPGAFSLEGTAQEADLSFRLSYQYGLPALAEDLNWVLKNIWLLIPLLLAFWLPGRVLLHFIIHPRRESGAQSSQPLPALDWGERSAFSLGLSLSLVAVTLLWSKVFRLPWNAGLAWAACAGLSILLAWLERGWFRQLRSRLKEWYTARTNPDRASPGTGGWRLDWTVPALAGIFLLTAGVRLAMVRDLAAPAWVDSVHHALIMRKIMEVGMLPDNYLPYLESQYATYHSGFHASAAFFLWLSGMTIPSGLLLFSQVMNALCVFPVYLFTTSLTRSRLAGLFASLIAGLFTPMPAYYASWGRFTQLAGLLILPVSLAIFIRLTAWLEGGQAAGPAKVFRPPALAELLLLSISLAGLALTHYRVLAFLACLLAVYTAGRLIGAARRKQLGLAAGIHLTVLSASAGLAILLNLPWWPQVIHSLVFPQAAQAVSSLGRRLRLFDDFAWGYLDTALGKQAMLLAGLGWVLGILRRRSFPWILLAWVASMFLLANPGAFGIPGLRIVNNTSVEIVLFMPFALLGGYLLAEVVQFVERKLTRRLVWLFRPVVLAASLLAGLAGARALLPILNQGTFLIRQADLAALQWAESNLPAGETVVINSFLWGYNKLAGSDGGYWAAPLAGVQSLPPPVLHSLSNPLTIQKQADNLSRQLFDQANSPVDLAALMEANQLRYIILGAKGGILSPKALVQSGLFAPVYHHNGSWVLVLN